ncbi:MAG: hypothetical protein QI199_04050, partial [Candidatus Korarchaeota archaeon]|nr:hypothetical protein [Candidatus Korarchaeota archaeon]
IAEENVYELAGVVWLTDGNGDYPESEPEYPVLWVLSQGTVTILAYLEGIETIESHISARDD